MKRVGASAVMNPRGKGYSAVAALFQGFLLFITLPPLLVLFSPRGYCQKLFRSDKGDRYSSSLEPCIAVATTAT